MLAIFKNLSLSSVIKAGTVLVILTLIAIILLLNDANMSLSQDNRTLNVNAVILKTANAEGVETIAKLMYQLKQNEHIAYKRSVIANDITKKNIEIKHVLVEAIKESSDENIVEWSEVVVPDDIISLLSNTRSGYSDKVSKINSAKNIERENILAKISRQNESRPSQLYF